MFVNPSIYFGSPHNPFFWVEKSWLRITMAKRRGLPISLLVLFLGGRRSFLHPLDPPPPLGSAPRVTCLKGRKVSARHKGRRRRRRMPRRHSSTGSKTISRPGHRHGVSPMAVALCVSPNLSDECMIVFFDRLKYNYFPALCEIRELKLTGNYGGELTIFLTAFPAFTSWI